MSDTPDFRSMLPPEVRDEIEYKESLGVSLEEQGAITDLATRRASVRPEAPTIATDEVEGLFGTSEDPQTGRIHYLARPEERE